MKYMKHMILIFIMTIFATGTILSTDATVSAAEETEEENWTEDGFGYSVDEELGTLTITEYSGADGDVTIPSVIDGKPVTSIASNAFRRNDWLTSLTIPDSITTIEKEAFYDCKNLVNIYIPNSIIRIENDTFAECSSLTTIEIPNSVTSIGDYAFRKCSSLTTIEIPSSVTSIGDYAFGRCSSLTAVNIPSNVTSIGAKAFMGCSSLTTIEIPNSVTSIEPYTFSNCSSLQSVTSLGNSVTTIGECAFELCSNLTAIEIPSSVTSIGDYAFVGCDSLRSVTSLGNSVTTIGERAFRDTPWLTNTKKSEDFVIVGGYLLSHGKLTGDNIVIPESVTSIGDYAFSDNCDACYSITSIKLPDGVTSIGNSAFSSCGNLASINIPNSVISIGDRAFLTCDLTSIIIPDSVTSIGDRAFCDSLCSIVIPDSVTSIGKEAFSSNPKETVDIYYTGSESDWKRINDSSFGEDVNITVHYKSTFPSQITIDTSESTIYKSGSKFYLGMNLTMGTMSHPMVSAFVTPKDVTATKIIWSSSDESVISLISLYPVDIHNTNFVKLPNDTVWLWAANPGTATITAQTANGLTATIEVTVLENLCETFGHEEKILKGIPATFVDNGQTDGIYCTRCCQTVVPQVEIPPCNHKWGKWVITKPATKTSTGVMKKTCTICGRSLYEKIPILTDSTIKAPSNVKKVTAKSKKKKEVTLSWKKVLKANGYEIQYATNKKFKSCKTRTTKKITAIIKKLKKNKTYYFRIRAYTLDGTKKVYGKWSSIKKVKVKK